MNAGQTGGGSGCGGCIAAVLAIGAVVAAVISIAALIDPFSWMPPVSEIWADCQDNFATSKDECELATRYPGFWGHAVINFAYVVASAGLLLWLGRTALALREARRCRFSGGEAVKRYERARETLALSACSSATLAALPFLVALF